MSVVPSMHLHLAVTLFPPPPRLLEAQLQTQSRHHEDELEALRTQIELLRDDLEHKQELLNHTLALPPDAQVDFSIQQEITRLTNENLVCGKKEGLGRKNKVMLHEPESLIFLPAS